MKHSNYVRTSSGVDTHTRCVWLALPSFVVAEIQKRYADMKRTSPHRMCDHASARLCAFTVVNACLCVHAVCACAHACVCMCVCVSVCGRTRKVDVRTSDGGCMSTCECVSIYTHIRHTRAHRCALPLHHISRAHLSALPLIHNLRHRSSVPIASAVLHSRCVVRLRLFAMLLLACPRHLPCILLSHMPTLP